MKFGKIFALISCFSILSVVYSCKKPLDPCNTENPSTDFPWLQTHIDSIDRTPCKIEAHMFTYEGAQTIYVIGCNELNEASLLFDCSGTILCEFRTSAGINTCSDFDSASEYIGQIYPE